LEVSRYKHTRGERSGGTRRRNSGKMEGTVDSCGKKIRTFVSNKGKGKVPRFSGDVASKKWEGFDKGGGAEYRKELRICYVSRYSEYRWRGKAYRARPNKKGSALKPPRVQYAPGANIIPKNLQHFKLAAAYQNLHLRGKEGKFLGKNIGPLRKTFRS